MIVDVKGEINKYKNCNDRDKLERAIQDFKKLALQNASDVNAAMQINSIVLELQKVCDKLPAPKLKNIISGKSNIPVKTAKITSHEAQRIETEWEKKARKK